MRWLQLGVVTFALALGAGCAVTRGGVLARFPGGPTIPVEVEVRRDSVAVRGVHPVTGESLAGTLHAGAADRDALERPPSLPEFDSGASPGAPRDGLTPASPAQATVTLEGTLRGDQGTVLECTIMVERRIRLRGGGVCRLPGGTARDPLYRLTF